MHAFDHASGGGNGVELVGNGIKTTFPSRAAAVTESDATTFSVPSAIYVGGAGDVVVTPAHPDTPGPITFLNVPAGSLLPVMVTQVRVATTATDMVRIW